MPTPVVHGDRIEWMFREPVEVETPGPNLSIRTVMQYRDRLVIECGIMARIEVSFVDNKINDQMIDPDSWGKRAIAIQHLRQE